MDRDAPRKNPEGEQPEREPLSFPLDVAEGVDLPPEDPSGEILDAVDDNLQEPPQLYTDDENDLAEQQ